MARPARRFLRRKPWYRTRAGGLTIALLTVLLVLGGAATVHEMMTRRPGQTIGGDFTLIDQSGHKVTSASLAGHYALIYFGYTHCIDVCPLTLTTISEALKALGPVSDDIQPVFITVDPQRDTPTVMGDYVRNFSPRIIGLTGSPTAIRHVISTYHVVAARHPGGSSPSGQNYLMDHSSVLYLMDPQNHFVAALPVDTSAANLAARIRALLPTR